VGVKIAANYKRRIKMAKYVFIYVSIIIVGYIGLRAFEFIMQRTIGVEFLVATAVLWTAIPAKEFVKDFKEPPTKKQKHSFALGVLLVTAILAPIACALLYDHGFKYFFSKLFDMLSERYIELPIDVVFIVALVLEYALLYFLFGMSRTAIPAKEFVKDFKEPPIKKQKHSFAFGVLLVTAILAPIACALLIYDYGSMLSETHIELPIDVVFIVALVLEYALICFLFGMLRAVIPAKEKDPPTKKQKHSFAFGVLLVTATLAPIACALLIYDYSVLVIYDYGSMLSETHIELPITVVFIVILIASLALEYALIYFLFGMFANMCVKDLKKRENNTD
jgi:MFS family permease